jgi:hypothetical protein
LNLPNGGHFRMLLLSIGLLMVVVLRRDSNKGFCL